MIYKNKTALANKIGCGRQKIYRMLDNNEIKKLYIDNKVIGYIIVLDFIKELIKDYDGKKSKTKD